MAFRPLHDRVLLRRLDTEATTKGGIIIPDTAAKRDAANCRAMNTVNTRNAGAQPTPISTCPHSRAA